jgi:hypothetical protein
MTSITSPTATHMPPRTPVFGNAFGRALATAGLALLLSGLQPAPVQAQSDAISRPSELSVAASVEVPAAALSALAEGGKLVVDAVMVSGGVAAITISAVGIGTSFVVYISLEALKAGAIAIGNTLEAVVVSGGWLLYAGSEAVCFVADEATRAHLHSREITS